MIFNIDWEQMDAYSSSIMALYIKLFIAFSLIGMLFIAMGLITWKTKKNWFHKKFIPRVDQSGYEKFMGLLDIITGISFIIIGMFAIAFQIKPPLWLCSVPGISWLVIVIYGEFRFKTDEKEYQRLQLERYRRK